MKPFKFDTAKTAKDLLNQLFSSLPSWRPLTHSLIAISVVAVLLLLMCSLLPVTINLMLQSLCRITGQLHGLNAYSIVEDPGEEELGWLLLSGLHIPKIPEVAGHVKPAL